MAQRLIEEEYEDDDDEAAEPDSPGFLSKAKLATCHVLCPLGTAVLGGNPV